MTSDNDLAPVDSDLYTLLEPLPTIRDLIMDGKFMQARELCERVLQDGGIEDYLSEPLRASSGVFEARSRDFIASILVESGNISRLQGDNPRAVREYNIALEFARADRAIETEARVLTNLAYPLVAIDDYQQAFAHLNKAASIFSRAGNTSGLAFVWRVMGTAYAKRAQHNDAMAYYTKAMDLLDKSADTREYLGLLVSMGISLARLERYSEAETLYEEALSIAEANQWHHNLATLLVNFGLTLKGLGRQFDARQAFERAAAILEELGDSIGALRANVNLHTTIIDADLSESACQEAFAVFDSALSLFEQNKDFRSCASLCRIISQVHEAKGMSDKALAALKRSVQFERQRSLEESESLLAILRTIHELETLHNEAEQMRARNTALESKLDSANAQMHELFERVKMQDRLISVVSHDLKNPISNILLAQQLLHKHLHDEDALQLSALITDTAQSMDGLVHDLLESAALKAGKIELNLCYFDFAELIEISVARYTSMAKAKSQELRIDIAPIEEPMLSDPARLSQVVDNLISNAVKYSPHGGTIDVIVRQEQEQVSLRVNDHGPGIDPDQLHRLFLPFQKLGSVPTAGESSTGVGLSIAHQLTTLLGGTLGCDSTPGKGSSFVLSLPTVYRSPRAFDGA